MGATINRRDFLKGAAIGAVGVTGAGLLGGCSPKQTSESQSAGAAQASASDDFVMTADALNSKWSFEIAPDPIADDQITETVEAEIVVVGAGASGLSTALSAAENGADVVLISASKAPCSRGGSVHGVYSKVMERMGVERYDVAKYTERERVMAANGVDQRKWSLYFRNSEESMNWFIDRMESKGIPVGIEGTAPRSVFPEGDAQYAPLAAHGTYSDELKVGGGASLMVNAMAELLEDNGGRLFFETKGEQLIRDDNNTGRVSAVVAKDLSSDKYKKFVASKAVVLATGDFSADKEMMAKYCPSMLSLISDEAGMDYDVGPATTGLYKGDGHKMGLWVGAGWQHTVPNCPMVNVAQGTAAQPYCGHCGLTLNINGERFSNELAMHSYTGHAVLMQPDKVSFPIWGSNYAADNAPWEQRGSFDQEPMSLDAVFADWEKKVESGRFVKADTLEELLEKLELPKEAALASIKRYNELCEKGYDEDFFKRADQMIPVKDAPFYGSKVGGRFLTVLGGLRTNPDLQVCEDDDTPIEGLYNVGTMVGDFYNNTYSFLMEGLNYGSCITFGWLLGKNLAAK